MEPFVISERDLGYDSDNLINYNAGPVYISVKTYEGVISLKTTYEFSALLYPALYTACAAWEVPEENIVNVSEVEAHIKYDKKILENFIDYSIII